MEMEFVKLQRPVIRQFKIDLIVWKWQFMPTITSQKASLK